MQHEAQEQAALFNWAAYMPELKYMFAVPNGGSRNKIEAANLKRQGVKSGVPDICLPLPRGGYHGLYIELKYGKGKASANQKEYLEYLASVGYRAVICYGWDEARQTIEEYLKSVYEKDERVYIECDGLAGSEFDEIAVLAIVSNMAKDLGITDELCEKAEKVDKNE